MADKHTLAFEIGVEEIPAFDLDSANKQLEKMVPAAFSDARIPYDSIEIHSSPRRLIVMAYGVADARTVSLFYFLLAFSHCCAGILRGTGRPIIPMAIMLATWCALRIAYITAVTHFIPDIRVIYWAYPLTWFLGGLLFAVCLLRLRFPSDAALETYK